MPGIHSLLRSTGSKVRVHASVSGNKLLPLWGKNEEKTIYEPNRWFGSHGCRRFTYPQFFSPSSPPTGVNKLTPPAKGKIPVAFAISEGATVIDFAGPWEVFQDVHISDRGKDMDEQMPFQLFTVAEKIETITGLGRAQARTRLHLRFGATTKDHRGTGAKRIAGIARLAPQNACCNRRHNVCLHWRLSTRQGRPSFRQDGNNASRLFRSI